MQTHCLCTDDPPAHEFVPSLDVFDRALFLRVAELMRIPGWWYHPDAKPSALVLSFDEDWAGPRLTGFENPDFPTTWFVVDDSCIDANALSELKNGGASFQVHWNRFLIHLTKLGLHVCSRSLSSQVSRLRAKTGTSPRICRIHYLRWDSSLDNLFWVMKECGIEVDSSLGPGRGQHGYRFGTGFPYFVGDKDGNPIGVEEIPFQIHDPMGESTLEEKLRLIHEAAEQHHTAVVALFHPYYCQAGHRSHKQYTELLERIQTSSCWHASLEDLSDFWKARRSTGISSSLDDSLLRIRITGMPKAGMTLRLPDVTSLESVVVNKREVESSELIVLQAGDYEVEARYSGKCSHERMAPAHDREALIEEQPVSNYGRRFS